MICKEINMNEPLDKFANLDGKLLVSCQASDGDAFRQPESIVRFAVASVQGGAAGIRAEGADDVAAIRAAVDVPVIGIKKSIADDGRILITPSFEAARELVVAGADLVALDCTKRGQSYGALERLRRIKDELNVSMMADIATVEEALAAESAGADFVLSTMRGYTDETAHLEKFDAEFIAELCSAVRVPVIAEGRIWTIEDARAAIERGAFAVIIGSAITRPHEIARRFVSAVESAGLRRSTPKYVIAVDLGGTNIKSGIVSEMGELISHASDPTPSSEGGVAILNEIKRIVEARLEEARNGNCDAWAIGVATAGWVKAATGKIIYASGNLPGWTGTELGDDLRKSFALPVAVENDANAMAVAEYRFGAARGIGDFVCITLGTGVGCGVYSGGRLRRGAHDLSNNLAHMQIESDGLQCNCGRRGCFEVYANAAALVRYAGKSFTSAKDVIHAANAGNETAREAVSLLARRLTIGLGILIELADPSLVLIGGGVAQDNPLLLTRLRENLHNSLLAPEIRTLRIEVSPYSYLGGVVGAAAAAFEKFSDAPAAAVRV